MIFKLLGVLLLSCTILPADKPDLSGTWRVDGNPDLPDEMMPAITIVQDATNVRISDATGKTDSRVECNTIGKECNANIAGHPVRVSYWFNGPVLVETVYTGKDNDRVLKVRRSISEDGQKMTVEAIQIVPPGKSPLKLVYVREQQVAPTQ